MNETCDVVVVGGGLAGLMAAATAAGAGARVIVLEAHQPGGRATTTERDGFRLNEGPHALYLGGPAETALRELGVALTGGPPSQPYYGRVGDAVHLLPTSASTMARSRLLGLRGKARLGAMMQGLGKVDGAAHAHETATEWLDGLELPVDAAAALRSVLRVATYSNVLDDMSADAAIGQLQAAGRGVLYLDGGWQHVVEGVRAAAVGRGAGIRTHAAVTAVRAVDPHYAIDTGDAVVTARAVVVAAGGPAPAARLLAVDPGWQGRVGPPSFVSCLDLGLSSPATRAVLMGVDQPLYLSTHCPPTDLAPAGHTLVSLLRYLAPGDGSTADDDRAALRDHAAVAGIRPASIVMERFLRRMPAITAVPVPAAGGLAGRPGVAVPDRPGAFVAGDWVGPVGMLADATLASATAAGRAAADYAARLVGIS